MYDRTNKLISIPKAFHTKDDKERLRDKKEEKGEMNMKHCMDAQWSIHSVDEAIKGIEKYINKSKIWEKKETYEF